jgi:hypothetical protein
MRKKIIFLVVILFSLLGIFFVWQNNFCKKVCFNNNCFLVELAQTQKEISRGLMFRDSLAQNRGMLFIFEVQGVYDFWMKNTKIPLDIIWLNEEKEVVFIKNNAPPCQEDFCPSIRPNIEASYVLEINAGLAEKIGLKNGDKFVFPIFID